MKKDLLLVQLNSTKLAKNRHCLEALWISNESCLSNFCLLSSLLWLSFYQAFPSVKFCIKNRSKWCMDIVLTPLYYIPMLLESYYCWLDQLLLLSSISAIMIGADNNNGVKIGQESMGKMSSSYNRPKLGLFWDLFLVPFKVCTEKIVCTIYGWTNLSFLSCQGYKITIHDHYSLENSKTQIHSPRKSIHQFCLR